MCHFKLTAWIQEILAHLKKLPGKFLCVKSFSIQVLAKSQTRRSGGAVRLMPQSFPKSVSLTWGRYIYFGTGCLMKALYMDYGFYIWILKCDMVWNGAGISCVLLIISKEKLYTTEFDLFGCGPWKSGPRPSCFSANRGEATILSGEYVFLISSLCPALSQPYVCVY